MSKPTCIFCNRTGIGVQFAIFNPRFQPFGTACVECEKKIPAHITTPQQWFDEQNPSTITATALPPLMPPEPQRPRFNDCTQAFAVPGEDNIIDMIRPDNGRSWHYNQNLTEMRQRYPGAVIVDTKAFFAEIHQRKNGPIEWEVTTRENYWNMLEVLPPAYQKNGAFLVGEPMDHHSPNGQPRYSGFRQIGSIYYQASRPMTRAEMDASVEAGGALKLKAA